MNDEQYIAALRAKLLQGFTVVPSMQYRYGAYTYRLVAIQPSRLYDRCSLCDLNPGCSSTWVHISREIHEYKNLICPDITRARAEIFKRSHITELLESL